MDVIFRKANEKLAQQAKKQVKEKEKAERKVKKEMKERLMTKSDYEKLLQNEVNAICRLIDAGLKCISCGHGKTMFGGHFHSVGSNDTIRFHLDNIHNQDYHCNGEKSGNLLAYGRGLIDRYGKEYKEYVEYDLIRLYKNPLKLTIPDIQEATKEARKIVKELKQADLTYSTEQRISLRRELNKRLNIYKDNQ